MRGGQAGQLGIVADKGREQERAALERSGVRVRQVGGSCFLALRSKPVVDEGENFLRRVGEGCGCNVVTAQVAHLDRWPLQDLIVSDDKSRRLEACWLVIAIPLKAGDSHRLLHRV